MKQKTLQRKGMAESYRSPYFKVISIADDRIVCASVLTSETEDLDEITNYTW